jgi:hypothetical protein
MRRALREAKERKIWTFIVGVMVLRGIVSFEGNGGSTKTSSNIFLKNKRKLCHGR